MRIDNSSTGVYVRWVKCGYASTQDSASSVGGQARYSGSTPFQGALGTGFGYGACAKVWARKTTTLGGTQYLASESYFNSSYLF